MAANDQAALDESTVSTYVNAFERLFVIENLPAWNPHLRSKTAVRATSVKHFVDPLIACAALGLGSVHSHPPTIVHAKDKITYYEALYCFDATGDIDALKSFSVSQTVAT